MARAVAPRAEAAVDHADTELIGHDGQLETPGFFVVVQENDFSTAAPTCPLLFQRGGSKRLYTFLHLTACGEASLRRKKASRHYAYLPTPVLGGGWRAERDGRGNQCNGK